MLPARHARQARNRMMSRRRSRLYRLPDRAVCRAAALITLRDPRRFNSKTCAHPLVGLRRSSVSGVEAHALAHLAERLAREPVTLRRTVGERVVDALGIRAQLRRAR